MNFRKVFPWAVLAAIAASPVHADPITAAVTAIGGFFSTVGGTAVGGFLLRTAASVGLSALATALSPNKGQQQQRGISTSTTTAGGTQPQTVVLGRYATAGHHECPPMTHGLSGSDQVKYMTYVISLSDYLISDIAWVIVNGNRTRFTTQRADGDGYCGMTDNGGKYIDRAWLRWHDGTQTVADEMLVETYGGYERPWTEDHILTGVAYAAMTFKWDSGYTQFPEVLFEVDGAPLYDPRQDTSVGGDGDQIWDDVSTHAFTENPVVMIYNILRGLRLADGTLYGLGVDAEDLPLDRWVAAMNTCDEAASSGGGQRREKRYKAGIEFTLETEPLSVIEDLLKSCGGRVAECGGFWNISLGPAPFARAHIDDEDLIVSDPRETAPFRGLKDTYNSIHASHLDRYRNWVSRDAPTFYKDGWIQEDDGRSLVAELNLTTVTQYGQVQRLMQELVTDNRLMITHSLTLPPTALGLLPLDTLTWTSDEHGYEAKLFEIQSKVIDPATLNVKVALRERSPDEYVYEYYGGTDYEETPGYPEGIDDGSPDPEDNPTDEKYTDPVTGDPLSPVRPVASLGDVIALHDGAVSRSTDGGAEWVRLPGTFGPAREISAIDGQGFLVWTAGSEIAYSSALRRWNTLTPNGFSTESLAITNGDFEAGSLSGWTVNSGAPSVLDTAQPPQQGGKFYLASNEVFEAMQVVSLPPAVNTSKLFLRADVYSPDATAQIEVRSNWNGASYTLPDVRLYPEDPFNTNYQSDSLAEIRVSGDGASLIGDLINIEARIDTGDDERLGFRFKDIEGLRYWSGSVGNNISSQSDLIYISPPYGETLKDITINLSSPDRPGLSVQLEIPAGWRPPIGLNNVNPGYYSIDARHVSSQTHLSIPSLNPVGLIETRNASGLSIWETIEIELPSNLGAQVELFLRGSDGDYVDNVRAEVISEGDSSVRCIARDLAARRHLVATDTGIHAVVDGAASQLCETPFAADFLAGNDDMLVIASGADIAISEDNGASWSQHTAAGSVVDLHARPDAVAVLFDGSVISIAGAGLTEVSNLGSSHKLAYDARGRRWIAVSESGEVQSSADLAAWTPAPDMPISTAAGERTLIPLDIGRFIGRAGASKDLFWKDRASGSWSVGPSLTSQIRDMTEVK
ncbi:Putative phage tail protein [Cribrihabitans marinus]|uniref:Putative phage tail protein n=1 Tax=Cribrihabitans marinus TaxID=1227549 RepID=A0A1H6W9S3_9RHOB|nr:phage tail protein [Cribrihabitans marinus]GGH24373.1 hypothetical protein GCM10010973_10850 [Cribrihabitans marinus]SEJ13771.1 Putative phage tail protein [Cribrihabitans marinus]